MPARHRMPRPAHRCDRAPWKAAWTAAISPPLPPPAGEGGLALAEPQAAAAARRLGLHYLQRYFYLIAFRRASFEGPRGCSRQLLGPSLAPDAEGTHAPPPPNAPPGPTWTAGSPRARGRAASASGRASGGSCATCSPRWTWESEAEVQARVARRGRAPDSERRSGSRAVHVEYSGSRPTLLCLPARQTCTLESSDTLLHYCQLQRLG